MRRDSNIRKTGALIGIIVGVLAIVGSLYGAYSVVSQNDIDKAQLKADMSTIKSYNLSELTEKVKQREREVEELKNIAKETNRSLSQIREDIGKINGNLEMIKTRTQNVSSN